MSREQEFFTSWLKTLHPLSIAAIAAFYPDGTAEWVDDGDLVTRAFPEGTQIRRYTALEILEHMRYGFNLEP